MPVIKSNTSAGMLKEAIVLDLGDLGRQAAQLRIAAEAKAAQIISDAQAHAQKLVDGAEEKGFEQGRLAGYDVGLAQGLAQGAAQALEQAAQQLQQLHSAWTNAMRHWDEQRQDMQRQASQAVLDFALTFAQKLVHRVIETDQAVIVDQLHAALAHVLRSTEVSVRINPDDRPTLEQALPSLMADFTQCTHIHLVEDPSVGRGGCVLTYGQGQIDATIEKQLQRIISVLLPDPPQLTAADAQPLSLSPEPS
jgi:flagellar assembly protein FliH